MTDVSRVTVPENFFDVTSSKMLCEPEPQYPYALLHLSALGASLSAPGSAGTPDRPVMGSGAPYPVAEQDRLVLSEPLSTEIFAARVDFTGQPGHMVKFNRPAFTDSTYTEASRQVATGATISTTTLAFGATQTNLVLKRFGGPYSNANSAVQPIGIDRFDVQMGVSNLVQGAGAQLVRDHHKFLDSVWVTLFNQGASTIRALGLTTDDTATATGQFPLEYETLTRTRKAMNIAHLPTMPDGSRMFVCTSDGQKQLQDDPQFAAYAKENDRTNPLFSQHMNSAFPGQWFGKVAGFHCFVSETLSKVDNSSSIAIHNAHAIAPGAALVGGGAPPQVCYASDDNYGQTAKVIWLADYAMGLADSRFVYNVKYTEDHA